MTKALVTGGGGFLGLYLVEQLVERGDEVRVFCRGQYPELDRLGVETVQGDLRDRDQTVAAVQGVDIVYHTAALPGISMQWRPFYEINTLGTEHVIEGCQRHDVQRLVYTSSPSVTFCGEPQSGIDEEASRYPAHPLAHYPHSKALAEQAVLRSNCAELLTCSLRPHLIWGPRDHHLIPRLLDRARAGRLKAVGDRTNLVDMVYVENAARAHLQAADALTSVDSAPAGKAYFITQGEPVNCWGWIDEILALVDLPPVRRSVSYRAASCVGAVCEAVYKITGRKGEPIMTRFLAAQLAMDHYFDISRAQHDFGYEPIVSTEEGMRRLGRYLRETYM